MIMSMKNPWVQLLLSTICKHILERVLVHMRSSLQALHWINPRGLALYTSVTALANNLQEIFGLAWCSVFN
jgi:hypothetical protein